MPDILNTVGSNHWIMASFLLTFKFCFVGWGWSAYLANKLVSERGTLQRALISLALGVISSSAATLLGTMALSSHGWYSHINEWMFLAAVFVSGLLVFAFHVHRGCFKFADLKTMIPGTVILVILFAAVMWLPNRGEWIVGGWDPGIYLNQGIHMASSGSRAKTGSTFTDSLSREEQALFQDDQGNRKQIFPGVLVEESGRSLRFQFFPGTPAFVANLYRCGGLRAAVRMNHFAALLGVIELAALIVLVSSPLHALLAIVIFLLQPVLVWHLQMPISEMLQMFLVLGLLVLLSGRSRGWLFIILACLVMILTVLNRFSFIPFVSVLLFCVAWMDKDEENGRALITLKHAFLMLAIVLGGLLSWRTVPVTVAAWEDYFQGLIWLPAVLFVLIVLVDVLPRHCTPDRLWSLPSWLAMAAWALWVPLFIFGPPCLHVYIDTVDKTNLLEIVPYIGLGMSLLAWAGCVLVWLPGKPSRFLRMYVVFSTAVISILFLRKFIEPLYPWATRRYLHVAIPFVAVMASYTITWLKEFVGSWKPLLKAAWIAVLALALLEIAPSTLAAWRGTEYNGLSDALATVARSVPDDSLILADHFLFATPLMFIYGKDVLVVSNLKGKMAADRLESALLVLKRFTEHKNIFVLVSGREGLDYFPVRPPVGEAVLDLSLSTKMMIHHRRRHPFTMKDRHVIFKVFPLDLNLGAEYG